MDFNSHSDRVVAAAVGLVNAFTPGERRGRPYTPPADPAERSAAAFGVWNEETEGKALTEAELDELAAVAARLREVFEAVARGDVDGAAERVNRMLADTAARPRLARHDGEPWHLHFHGADSGVSAEWGGPCATGLAVVLGSELHDRLGVCTAPGCDRVYVDTSRNGTRRYCSTACQNRVKTAAFRARHSRP
ncbi:CGNR zinc finger domain-containing protein [Actinomadura logoneensis]|uniref:CGNR zinc finger domain-containing protein n=1 Tax=Actinomadura logoneensis TaxID=2293572 RepID=A0A372JDR6_9ACTN|nr:CGNR zinc finger domain-containing protein [Actinomadura logoneensis]RFU38155.1 CGNR zinc finger domain-containing protein [Actinomadura logoneensis]